MRVDLEKEEIEMIISSIKLSENWIMPEYSEIIEILQDSIYHEAAYEKKKNDLEKQEIWVKNFFNGYSCTFEDQMLSVNIRVSNPNFGSEDRFTGTTLVFAPINADKEGNIDLTPLLHTLLQKMKNNPGKEVKAYATGFSRQFHFNPKLLSTPIPETLLELFKNE